MLVGSNKVQGKSPHCNCQLNKPIETNHLKKYLDDLRQTVQRANNFCKKTIPHHQAINTSVPYQRYVISDLFPNVSWKLLQQQSTANRLPTLVTEIHECLLKQLTIIEKLLSENVIINKHLSAHVSYEGWMKAVERHINEIVCGINCNSPASIHLSDNENRKLRFITSTNIRRQHSTMQRVRVRTVLWFAGFRRFLRKSVRLIHKLS